MHLPVNHHLRPLYRTLTAIAGLYVLVFGIVGVSRTRGLPLFAQPGSEHLPWVLGLRANPAFAYLSILAGLVLVAGAVIGRNVYFYLGVGGGLAFLVAGLAMLTLLETGANFLGFSMVNCVVSFIIGLVVFAGGLFGRVAAPTDPERPGYA
jgi:Domain of unknown function (DUF4383)